MTASRAPADSRSSSIWTPSPKWALLCAFAAIVVVSLWMARERFELVGVGPDPDGDAYGHHVIAKELLKAPLQHGKHWVWLPLFHWLQLPIIALGGVMNTIRFINVAVWTTLPSLLFGYLLRDRWRKDVPRVETNWGDLLAATTASLILALTPLGMQMGTTAQPEPLFAVLLLLFAWGAERKRYWQACLCLTLAVLLRYEAWSVLAFAGAAVLVIVGRHLRATRTLHGVKGWLVVAAVPTFAILGWALLRLPHDSGRFMWFVGGTHDFAQGALLEKNSFQQGGFTLLFDLMRYVWVVPHRTFGIVAAVGLFGLWRVLTRHFWLSLASAAVLAFITFGWLMRSTLGLERHFVGVLAWYSTMMAFGVVQLVELGASALRRLRATNLDAPTKAGGVGLGVLGLGSAGLVAVVTVIAQPWLRDWRHAIEHTFADQLEVARFIDGVPHGAVVFCDEPTVEGLSHLSYREVQRGSIEWPLVREKIYAAADQGGATYVVSWLGKLARLPRQGSIVFRPTGTRDTSLGAEGHPDKSAGLAVMRIDAALERTSLAPATH